MRILYIRVPKTASSSISQSLLDMKENGIIKYRPHQHSSIEEIKKEYRGINLKKSIILGSVRNPYDRLLSAYTYIRKNKLNQPGLSFLKGMNTFEKFCFCLKMFKMKNVAFQNQSDWLIRKNKIICDFIIRYETLKDDWNRFLSTFDLPKYSLKLKRPSKHVKWKKIYTDQTKKIVSNLYKPDFYFFGYKK